MRRTLLRRIGEYAKEHQIPANQDDIKGVCEYLESYMPPHDVWWRVIDEIPDEAIRRAIEIQVYGEEQ